MVWAKALVFLFWLPYVFVVISDLMRSPRCRTLDLVFLSYHTLHKLRTALYTPHYCSGIRQSSLNMPSETCNKKRIINFYTYRNLHVKSHRPEYFIYPPFLFHYLRGIGCKYGVGVSTNAKRLEKFCAMGNKAAYL